MDSPRKCTCARPVCSHQSPYVALWEVIRGVVTTTVCESVTEDTSTTALNGSNRSAIRAFCSCEPLPGQTQRRTARAALVVQYTPLHTKAGIVIRMAALKNRQVRDSYSASVNCFSTRPWFSSTKVPSCTDAAAP